MLIVHLENALCRAGTAIVVRKGRARKEGTNPLATMKSASSSTSTACRPLMSAGREVQRTEAARTNTRKNGTGNTHKTHTPLSYIYISNPRPPLSIKFTNYSLFLDHTSSLQPGEKASTPTPSTENLVFHSLCGKSTVFFPALERWPAKHGCSINPGGFSDSPLTA